MTEKKTKKKNSIGKERLIQVVLNTILIIFGLLFLMPFFWAFSTSLRLPKNSFDLPPSFFPTDWRWGNYAHIFKAFDFLQFFKNSIKITFVIVFVGIFFTTLAAFAVAKLNFIGKNLLFFYIITGLMIPFQSYAIAQFMIMNKLKFVNSHWALILPYLANPFGLFLVTQNMRSIPDSYVEAAVIDGCSKFRVYWNIAVPMCIPTIVVTCFMKFIEQWNNFFAPLIYINSTEKFTLTMGMQSLKGFRSAGSLAYILAGVMISMTVPTLVYAFGQNFLTRGISLSGLKG